jgi:glycerophosphoryl diester phosphodiesterase
MECASERNLEVFVWTVDKKADMREFLKAGVQGIITNKPQDLLSLLD